LKKVAICNSQIQKDFCYVCDNQAIIIFEQTDNIVADWEVLRTNAL